ncbi:aminotransferase class V-fold PLP-dependent enzyme [bacterium]|nr:aminotransferase class V-fold PLP-dependent enzyme [bacterium]
MIYLDNAATTFPKPEEVYEKTLRFMKEGAGNPGRGSHHFSTTSAQMVENTRRQVARFFGITDHHRVIFTYNCTDSINMVLKGYLQPHDHVIATHLDHNSVSRPLESIVREKQIELTRLPFSAGGAIDPKSYGNVVRHNTKLVILNHGSNVLGTVQDSELFLRDGIPVLLDAAQTAGRIPIQLKNHPIFLACSAHKSLFGMPGLGILIVPRDIPLSSWREGGSGTASEELSHPAELPMHLEAGTPNFLSIAALSHGLTFIENEGMEKIHRKEWEFARILFEYLVSDPRFHVYSRLAQQDLAVLAFNLRNVAPDEVAAILDQRFGIAVRGGLHCAAVLHQQLNTLPDGCLRVSPGYFNTEEDLLILVEALKSIADGYIK